MKTRTVIVLSLMILALGFAGSAQAELGVGLWSEDVDGGYGNDYAYGTAIDSQGNVITAGYITGDPGPPDHVTNGYAIKYDSTGTPTGWSVELDSGPLGGGGGQDGHDTFNGVAVDSQDNIILVGVVAETWPTPPTNQSMIVQKYSSAGSFLWEQRWYDYGWAGIQDVFIDANDDIYVTGNTFTDWSGTTGQWVTLKYDKDGGAPVLGPIYYNYTGSMPFLQDRAYGIAVDAQGNIVVVGVRAQSGTDGGLTNDYDWHVRKYNSAGTLVWEDTYGGAANLYDYAMDVGIDSNGDIIVVGYTNKGTDNYDNQDYDWLVIKYDSAGIGGVGNRLWTRTFESAAGRSETCYDVAIDPDDNALVCGYEKDGSDVSQQRLEKLNGTNGALIDSRLWLVGLQKGFYALDLRGDTLALAGYIDNGTDHDFRTTVLNLPYGTLSSLSCLSPANESVISTAPTFEWTANGGSSNYYAVDMSLNYVPPIYSTWDNFRIPITDQSWTMSQSMWDFIPTGSYVYWRVRGADVAASPLSIITGNNIYWFYKY